MDEKEPLTILSFKSGISAIQKCYLPRSLMKSLNDCKFGMYALLRTSSFAFCLCKIYWRNDIHASFCQLDESVVVFSKCRKTSTGFPNEASLRTSKHITLNEIEPIQSCRSVKNLLLSVIFENVSERKKWGEDLERLQHIVKEILKLFILTSECIVFLKHLKPLQKFGIYCIVVHDIGSEESRATVAGRVVSLTNVVVSNTLSKMWIELPQRLSSVPLGGLDKPYRTLQEIICQNKFQHAEEKLCIRTCKQVLLVGPAGCGKTSLVRYVAADCGAVLVSVLGAEVYQPRPGDTETWLRRVFDEAADLAQEGLVSGGVCVLLLDEVDTMCPRRRGSTHQARVSVQLLTLLEHADSVPGLVVIATTSRPTALDPALRRPGRLETEVHIGIPTEGEREQILKLLTSAMTQHDTSELCQQVACLTPGYVGADLSLVCQDVVLRRHRRKAGKSMLTLDEMRESVSRVHPASLRGGLGVVTALPAKMSDIGGLDTMKQSLRAAVEWPLLYPQLFSKFALPHTRGVLLYGPPGCAKTLLVRALAYSVNVTFLSASAAQLYSPYVGDAEKSILELFHRARIRAPTILFIDEIDALVGNRGDRQNRGVQERVLSALLTEMDGIGVHLDTQMNSGVMVIAATNRPDMLDDALLRPGRFDKLLYVPPPSAEGRLDILRILTAKMPLGSSVDLAHIASHSKLFSGADLTNLCREAALLAMTEDGMSVQQVKQIHFMHTLQHMRASLSQQQVAWYSSYSQR